MTTIKTHECPEHSKYHLQKIGIVVSTPKFPEGIGFNTLFCTESQKYYHHSRGLLDKNELEQEIANSYENYKEGDVRIVENLSDLVQKTNCSIQILFRFSFSIC